VTSTYSADEVDASAVYCGQLEETFLVPIEVAEGKPMLHLRLHRRGIANAPALTLLATTNSGL
jgi:hypothetical protein